MPDQDSIEAGIRQTGLHGKALTLPQPLRLAETLVFESFPSVRNGKQGFSSGLQKATA